MRGKKTVSAKVEWLNKPKYEIERLLSKTPIDVARENGQSGRRRNMRINDFCFICLHAAMFEH